MAEPESDQMRPWAPATPVLAALVVAATVLFDPLGYAPFGPVKWAAISAVTLAAVAVSVTRPFTVHRASTLGWVAFLVWAGIAAVFAVDPLHAWIGTPDRRLGWMAWALFAAAFLVAQASRSAVDRRVIARTAVVAAAGVAAYSLAEIAGLRPVDVGGVLERIGGPFGSAAYLGAALVLLVPVCAATAADVSETRLWRWAAGAAAAGGLVTAVASQTRAAWLGLLVAAAVTGPVWWPWLRRRLWVGAATVVLLMVAVVATPVGGRLASAVDFDDGGARARIDEWRIGAAAFTARPVIGTGAEGYRVVFPAHVDADYARRYGRQVTPDRAHNGGLDVGISTGLPGVVLYLAAAVWLVIRSLRGIRTRDMLVVGFAAGVVGYLAQQQLLFPVAEIDPVFWVFAGVLVAATSRRGERRLAVPALPWLRVAATVLAVLAAIVGVADIAADHRAQTALDRTAAGDTAGALTAADQARTLRPDSIRYHLVAATVAAVPGDLAATSTALDRIDSALGRSPHDPILSAARARILLEGARSTGDADLAEDAVAAWRQRVLADLNHPGHHLEYGVALALVGELDTAESAWKAAASLAPAATAPLRNLATLYLETGRLAEAAETVEQALAIDPSDVALTALADRIADAQVPR